MDTITNSLKASVKDQEALLRIKVDVSIEKNVLKIRNLRATRECDVIMNEWLKVKVKELLDL
jgi:hypothetical protein